MQRNIDTLRRFLRYESHSDCKSLIYISFTACLFFGQLKQSLDFQGLAGSVGELSTKLSTENLESR